MILQQAGGAPVQGILLRLGSAIGLRPLGWHLETLPCAYLLRQLLAKRQRGGGVWASGMPAGATDHGEQASGLEERTLSTCTCTPAQAAAGGRDWQRLLLGRRQVDRSLSCGPPAASGPHQPPEARSGYAPPAAPAAGHRLSSLPLPALRPSPLTSPPVAQPTRTIDPIFTCCILALAVWLSLVICRRCWRIWQMLGGHGFSMCRKHAKSWSCLEHCGPAESLDIVFPESAKHAGDCRHVLKPIGGSRGWYIKQEPVPKDLVSQVTHCNQGRMHSTLSAPPLQRLPDPLASAAPHRQPRFFPRGRVG